MTRLFFFLLLLCPLCSGAQTFSGYEDDLVVIAPDGLRLRAQPNRKARVLATAPFGAKVEKLSDETFGRDTAGQLTLYNEGLQRDYTMPIDGYWVKVRYGQNTGYMFSAYLGGAVNDVADQDKELNREAILLYPGMNCFGNFFYQPGWYWYGAYDNGQGLYFKATKPAFYTFYFGDEPIMAGDFIAATDNRFLQFIIGSKEPLAVENARTEFSSKNSDGSLFSWEGVLNDTVLNTYHLSILREDPAKFIGNERLQLESDGLRQVISPPSANDEAWVLEWCGDLDGDGRRDFIIRYGEKGSRTILYLSKGAGKNQLVRPVAVFYAGYCC